MKSLNLWIVLLATTTAVAQSEKKDDPEDDYDKNAMRAAPRDAFPVLNDPKLVGADDAADIKDEEPVIGVEVGGKAKAYPISVMGIHELGNDTCGDTPIAVSW